MFGVFYDSSFDFLDFGSEKIIVLGIGLGIWGFCGEGCESGTWETL